MSTNITIKSKVTNINRSRATKAGTSMYDKVKGRARIQKELLNSDDSTDSEVDISFDMSDISDDVVPDVPSSVRCSGCRMLKNRDLFIDSDPHDHSECVLCIVQEEKQESLKRSIETSNDIIDLITNHKKMRIDLDNSHQSMLPTMQAVVQPVRTLITTSTNRFLKEIETTDDEIRNDFEVKFRKFEDTIDGITLENRVLTGKVDSLTTRLESLEKMIHVSIRKNTCISKLFNLPPRGDEQSIVQTVEHAPLHTTPNTHNPNDVVESLCNEGQSVTFVLSNDNSIADKYLI